MINRFSLKIRIRGYIREISDSAHAQANTAQSEIFFPFENPKLANAARSQTNCFAFGYLNLQGI